jgi:hypothetical protein
VEIHPSDDVEYVSKPIDRCHMSCVTKERKGICEIGRRASESRERPHWSIQNKSPCNLRSRPGDESDVECALFMCLQRPRVGIWAYGGTIGRLGIFGPRARAIRRR